MLFFYNFFTYIKKSKDLSAEYYQINKEKLQEKSREKYQSLSKEGKEKKATVWSSTIQKSTRR